MKTQSARTDDDSDDLAVLYDVRLVASKLDHPGALRIMWEYWGERIALQLANNPHTPADVFGAIRALGDPSVERALPGAMLRRRLRDTHVGEVAGVAALAAVASDETRSGVDLAFLARQHSTSPLVAIALANNRSTMNATLDILARHRDHRVREAAQSAIAQRRTDVSLARLKSRDQAAQL